MPQTINTNLSSLAAQRALNATQGSLSTSMQRLSSGLRVNSAKPFFNRSVSTARRKTSSRNISRNPIWSAVPRMMPTGPPGLFSVTA